MGIFLIETIKAQRISNTNHIYSYDILKVVSFAVPEALRFVMSLFEYIKLYKDLLRYYKPIFDHIIFFVRQPSFSYLLSLSMILFLRVCFIRLIWKIEITIYDGMCQGLSPAMHNMNPFNNHTFIYPYACKYQIVNEEVG